MDEDVLTVCKTCVLGEPLENVFYREDAPRVGNTGVDGLDALTGAPPLALSTPHLQVHHAQPQLPLCARPVSGQSQRCYGRPVMSNEDRVHMRRSDMHASSRKGIGGE
jgi:hypothetical protein